MLTITTVVGKAVVNSDWNQVASILSLIQIIRLAQADAPES